MADPERQSLIDGAQIDAPNDVAQPTDWNADRHLCAFVSVL
jgi:hypothetical protein